LALIGAYDEEPRKQNIYADVRYQRYLAHLESTVVGEPGRPRAIPEPYQEPPEAGELLDGPVAPSETPGRQRKRKPVRKADMLALDRDAVNLARYARKITGRE
jgi:hypothetical protein